MRVLHFCSYYVTTPLYGRLIAEMDRRALEQEVFIPTWTPRLLGHNRVDGLEHGSLHYVHAYGRVDRLTTRRKIRKAYAKFEATLDPRGVDMAHAHSLFINGGMALRLKREHGIEYVVAVRSTDINLFLNYAIHLRSFGASILDEARHVVLISPAYRDELLRRLEAGALRRAIEKKIRLIPNGIEDFWLEGRPPHRSRDSSVLRVLYVGNMLRPKNINMAMDAVEQLADRGRSVRFTIVGSGPHESSVNRRAKRRPDLFERLAWVESRRELLEIYRESDVFVMPSVRETFGLVYIEAMSQGIPVIHARGHGIDGYFVDGEVGRAVDPSNPMEIAAAIEDLAQRHDEVSPRAIATARSFSWGKVASAYEAIYSGRAVPGRWGSRQ